MACPRCCERRYEPGRGCHRRRNSVARLTGPMSLLGRGARAFALRSVSPAPRARASTPPGGSRDGAPWRWPDSFSSKETGLALPLADLVGPLGRAFRPAAGLSLPRRLQRHSGAAGLRESDGDCLLRRPGAVLPATDVLHLLTDELPGCRRRALALPQVLPGLLQRLLLRHGRLPPPTNVGHPPCRGNRGALPGRQAQVHTGRASRAAPAECVSRGRRGGSRRWSPRCASRRSPPRRAVRPPLPSSARGPRPARACPRGSSDPAPRAPRPRGR